LALEASAENIESKDVLVIFYFC